MAKKQDAGFDPTTATAADFGIPESWGEVETADILGWSDMPVGEPVRGRFLRTRPAGQGDVLDLMVGDEKVTYGCPRVLKRKLEDLPANAQVCIVPLGKTLHTANGVAYDFRVFSDARKTAPAAV